MRQLIVQLNKRLMTLVLAAVLMLVWCLPCVAADTSGSCGDGVTWQYADGTLTVSGSGAMADYTQRKPAPWASFSKEIRVLKVEQGVTSIGNYAFFGHTLLATVSLPDSVASIGDFAFADCTALKMITLGSSLRTIGEGAFESCTSLQSVRLPSGLSEIGNKAFHGCSALLSVTVPLNVTSMGNMAFARCVNLVSATIEAQISTLPLWSFYGCESLTTVILSSNIKDLGNNAFYHCDKIQKIEYLGTEATGETILDGVKEDLPDFFEDNFITAEDKADTSVSPSTPPTSSTTTPTVSTVDKSQITSGETEQDITIVSEQVTVQNSDHATISTTVTTTTIIGGTETDPTIESEKNTVKMEAVIDAVDGWAELVKQIKAALSQTVESKDPELKVSVSLNVNDETSLNKEHLMPIAGEDVKLTVEMKDGSSYRVDCQQLENAALSEKEESKLVFAYALSVNREPTEEQIDIFGDVDSFLLNFNADSALNYSPRIYLGSDYVHQCAVLYQQLKGKKIERVQSAIVGQDGYATFYLGQTLSTVQYYIAVGVENETMANAIIPDELAVDMGITAEYEPIKYVVTGERIFMGLNLSQFSFFLFGGLGAMIVIVGIVMAVIYRKRRLEFMYRMKAAEEDALAQAKAKKKDE